MRVTFWQHALGALAERHGTALKALARLETASLDGALEPVAIDRPVFIAGLARAGSTILLELLAKHPDVATHRYRDFPFVQIPVWWNRFLDRAGAGRRPAVERAHGDGIRVTPDSPEAMEEVLWMAHFPAVHDPAVSNVLGAETACPAFEAAYRDNIRKVLWLRGGRRYLAKGNYNLARLGYVARLFPDARFLVPVREPAAHVASLMRQQARFTAAARREPRIRAYMRRAGHFEFGPDRRPVNFGDDAAVARAREFWNTSEAARGWAVCLASAYDYLAALLARNPDIAARTRIVVNDELRRSPEAELSGILDHCALDPTGFDAGAIAGDIHPPAGESRALSAADEAAVRDETRAAWTEIRRRADDGAAPPAAHAS